MIRDEIRNAVRTLQAQGRTLREISRLLKLSRNTVRRILRAPERHASAAPPCDAQTLALLEATFERARGNVVRAQELLAQEQGRAISYSTLTRWVRQAGLRPPAQRSGEYTFAPGEEMQHDTSPHRVVLAGKTVSVQCAALVLAYSRRQYVRLLPAPTPLRSEELSARCRTLHGRHLPDLHHRQHQRHRRRRRR
jgi:transposase